MSKEKELSIYNMKLHQKVLVNDGEIQIVRVHGGWIYTINEFECRQNIYNGADENFRISSVFVRYTNEFQEPNKDEAFAEF